MKQTLFLSLLLLPIAFPLISNSVIAEESTNSASVTSVRELKEDKKDLIASREAKLKLEREIYSKKREEITKSFKEGLEKIKDSRKKQVVSNVADRITNRNTAWVSHWNEVTKRLTSILDKIQTKTTEASSSGKDVTAVNSSITTARNAISAAQAAIDAQSQKTYAITIDSEGTLGTNVSTTIKTFQSDVKNVISLLNVARKAVSDVFSTIRLILSQTQSPTVSPTASPSATTQP